MPLQYVSHHRLASSPHGAYRWRVVLTDTDLLEVELQEQDRGTLELTDEEIHELLPTALSRWYDGEPRDVPWDEPVRLYADHFRG